MELSREDLQTARDILVAQWQVAPPPDAPEDLNYAMLLEALEERISFLLHHNPNKLLTALYILDISERRYTQAMDQPTMQDRAHDLARAILERETEKIISRRRYSKTSDFQITRKNEE